MQALAELHFELYIRHDVMESIYIAYETLGVCSAGAFALPRRTFRAIHLRRAVPPTAVRWQRDRAAA